MSCSLTQCSDNGEVLVVCIGKNVPLFCIISSHVTLLVTEVLGQFQGFLNTPRNHQFMYINKSAFHPFFIEHYLITYNLDAALFDLFV